jgi:acyl-CoA thioesterase II
MPTSLVDQVAVEPLGSDDFVSRCLPLRMGNAMPIAYGGCSISIGLSSAVATVKAGYNPYSVMGHFHGPAATDRKLYTSVQRTRDTRSFATRRVQVKQKQDDGKERVVMDLMVDFHIQDQGPFEYSAPPAGAWPKPVDCLTLEALANSYKDTGRVTAAQHAVLLKTFASSVEHFDTRPCVNGVAGQNLNGAAKNLPTTQDNLPLTSKLSAEWQRTWEALPSIAAKHGVLGFLMDGALSFLPLSHSQMWFDDVGACSSIDFALRVFVPVVDLGEWHLRERQTYRGGGGRTYSEGRLFDEQGRLVASMTQQSIMRGLPEGKGAKI